VGRLASKVALVTGATSGIGKAIAVLFAREGAKVVVVGRSIERGNAVVSAIRSRGGAAVFVAADVTREADCRNMIERCMEEYRRLDILVNNAGTTSTTAIEDAEEAEYDRIMDTNLKSVFFACKYAVPIMKSQGKGAIITVTSRGAVIPTDCSALYAASKAGATQLTQAIAINYGKYGIRANSLLPSYIDTPMTDEYILKTGQDRASALKSLADRTPIGRIGTPEDCAWAALFLASDEAGFVTGTPMLVDGGAVFS